MELTISYLAAARLGELEGLAANEISPMRDLGPVIAGMRESFGPEGAEKLDELLALQGLTVSDGGAALAAPQMSAFLRALFLPEVCIHTRMDEPGGCSAVYYLPIAGAWMRVDAVRGQLRIALPLPESGMAAALSADVRAALTAEGVKLLAERRTAEAVHGAVVTADEKGYAVFACAADRAERACVPHIDVLPKTAENAAKLCAAISGMLCGRRAAAWPEAAEAVAASARPGAGKARYGAALRGFLIALAVNGCVALIMAVLNAVL